MLGLFAYSGNECMELSGFAVGGLTCEDVFEKQHRIPHLSNQGKDLVLEI